MWETTWSKEAVYGMSRVKAHIEAACDLARRHGAAVEVDIKK